MKAGDLPYVVLGLSLLAAIAWFSIWQTLRRRRSDQALASDRRQVVEALAGVLHMQLETGAARGGGLSARLPSMKAVVRDHLVTLQPTSLDLSAPLGLTLSIAVVPSPGVRWTLPAAGTEPGSQTASTSERDYLRAKCDRLMLACPSQQKRIQDLFAPERVPLRVVGAHVVSRSISVDLQSAGDSHNGTPPRSSTLDPGDLRRIVDDLVSIAEALPSQPA